MFREIPSRSWKSSKRVTPMKTSRTMSIDHHSPTTSRHWATEQCISAKLLRSTHQSLMGCMIECNPSAGSAGYQPVHGSTRGGTRAL